MLIQIPLPVTSGLFLYLGVSGLGGNEMWERTKLLVTDKKLRPKNVSVKWPCCLFICRASCVANRGVLFASELCIISILVNSTHLRLAM